MTAPRSLEAQIAEHERWLAGQPSPQPGDELIGQIKLAVRSEAAVLALDAEAGPQPGAELIERVKSAVRAEALRARPKRDRWSRWLPLAAAAVLTLAVLGPWRTMPGRSVGLLGGGDRAVDELLVALADVIDLDRPLLAEQSLPAQPDQAELEVTADSELALESLLWEVQALFAQPAESQTSPG